MVAVMILTTEPSSDEAGFLAGVGIISAKKPWECDPRSIFKKNIEAHRRRLSEAYWFPPNYAEDRKTELPMADLIARDINQLLLDPQLGSIKDAIDRLVIVEDFAPSPDAKIFTSPEIAGSAVMVFHSPLIYFLNSFFATYACFSSFSEFHAAFELQVVSQGLFDLVEELNIKQILDDAACVASREIIMERQILQCFSPIDVSERIEGARFFIAAHELAHVLLRTSAAPEYYKWFERACEAVSKAGRQFTGYDLTREQIEHLVAEMWCDCVAMNAILRRESLMFLVMQDYGEKVGRFALRRTVNTLCGIALLFAMYEVFSVAVISRAGADYTAALERIEGTSLHPAARLRFSALRDYADDHDRYNGVLAKAANPWIAEFCNSIWPFFETLWRFADPEAIADARNFTPEKFRSGTEPTFWHMREMFKNLEPWTLDEVMAVTKAVEIRDGQVHQLALSEFQEKLCQNLGQHLEHLSATGHGDAFWKWTT
jgi:hypothetical protein